MFNHNRQISQLSQSVRPSVLLVMLSSILTLSSVHAAAPTPGTVLDPVDKPVYKPAPQIPPAIQSGAKQQTLTSPATAKKIKVKKFILKGNTIFSSEQLLGIIASYQGTTLSLAEIYQVADIIENHYRRNGYLLASVYLPAQKVSSGNIVFEVIEGRLGELLVEGELQSYTTDFILKQTDEVSSRPVVNETALEKETMLLNELPGLKAQAVISPGKDYGSSDITFVAEEDRISGTARLNNYGRVSIGEVRLEAGMIYANPFTQGDQLNVSAIVSESASMTYVRVDYDALIDTDGTRLGGGVSAFDYEVDTAEINLPGTLEGDGTNYQLRITRPLKRSRLEQLDVGAVIRHNESDESGTLSTLASPSIDLLDVQVSWRVTLRNRARTSFSAMLSTNFGDNSDGTKNDEQKAKITLDAGYIQPLRSGWFWSGRANAVYSPDPLVDVERYRIGGPGSVRAFPSAELAGDRGGMLSLETGKSFRARDDIIMTAKAFVDVGRVIQDIPSPGQPDSESISGVGFGLTTLFGSKHSLLLEVVEPNGDRISSDGRDTRGWVNYSALF